MPIHKKGQRFPTDLDTGKTRQFQNPPKKMGAGTPKHKKHRLGQTDEGVGMGVRRFNP